ncbi:MAG: hypothetical protein E6H39_06100 [Betaproteobacteria bacterium]|nr:MAG: hypothetical protein E6H39_06100 [Betaproteobacteria bacterium]
MSKLLSVIVAAMFTAVTASAFAAPSAVAQPKDEKKMEKPAKDKKMAKKGDKKKTEKKKGKTDKMDKK